MVGFSLFSASFDYFRLSFIVYSQIDYHHDWIFPSSKTVAELMPRILATFAKKGIKPKQHLSSPRKGAVTIMEKRAHSDRILTLPDCLPVDMDVSKIFRNFRFFFNEVLSIFYFPS